MENNKPKSVYSAFKTLHGNNARINKKARVIPSRETYVLNDYKTANYGRVYNRLEDDAEFCKKEVDAHKM